MYLQAAFAFAGGNAPALPRLVSPKVWLLGVHTEKNRWGDDVYRLIALLPLASCTRWFH